MIVYVGCWSGENRSILEGDRRRLRCLINLQRKNSRTNYDGCDCDWRGSESGKIELKYEITRAIETDPPKRLAQKFVALTAMKFVEEIIKVAWRGLFESLQSKQFRDFVFVQFVHLLANQLTGFFRNSSK